MARVIVDTWFAAHQHQVSKAVLRKRRKEWGYSESERGWRRTIREADGSSSLILVATEECRVVGVAASEVAITDCVEVGALYVDAAHQRSGIGRGLLRAIIRHYRTAGKSTLRIAVLATNRGAIEFYEDAGGRLSGFRVHEDGPEVVYEWNLLQSESDQS